MGRPIPFDYRKLIIKRKNAGQTFSEIAQHLGYSLSGIKKVWYNYQRYGSSSLQTNYKNCGRKPSYTDSTYDLIDKLRNAQQGASYIYSKFQLQHPDESVPCIRTIQRYWASKKANRPKGRPCKREKKLGQLKHIILGK